MAKAQRPKTYVLYGCPTSLDERYDRQGYVGKFTDGKPELVPDLEDAVRYVDDKEPGHGTPNDWAELFKEDYGLNVRPVFLKD